MTTTNLLLQEGLVRSGKTWVDTESGRLSRHDFAVSQNEVVTVVLGSDTAESSDGAQVNTARFDDTRTLMDAVQSDYLWLDQRHQESSAD